jgi:tRNA modification GTPase
MRFIEAHKDRENLLVVWNKIDKSEVKKNDSFCRVSALTGEGFDFLEDKLRRMIINTAGGKSEENFPVIDSLRQKHLLERAGDALDRFRDGLTTGSTLDLLAVDLKEALDALGEITGEVTSADILEEIFSRFCVGK